MNRRKQRYALVRPGYALGTHRFQRAFQVGLLSSLYAYSRSVSRLWITEGTLEAMRTQEVGRPQLKAALYIWEPLR